MPRNTGRMPNAPISKFFAVAKQRGGLFGIAHRVNWLKKLRNRA